MLTQWAQLEDFLQILQDGSYISFKFLVILKECTQTFIWWYMSGPLAPNLRFDLNFVPLHNICRGCLKTLDNKDYNMCNKDYNMWASAKQYKQLVSVCERNKM